MLKKKSIKICLGSSCYSHGNYDLIKAVQHYLQKRGLDEKVEFSGEHCLNECVNGPNMRIDGKLYNHINTDTVLKILDEQLSDLIGKDYGTIG